jgi:hypothetical protein
MAHLDKIAWDIQTLDPTLEAALAAITEAQEIAILVRAETELFESETRQILIANHVLMEAACSSLEVVQAAVTLGQALAPFNTSGHASRFASTATTAATKPSAL